MRTPRACHRRPGFTLMELLVVILLIAVLASLTAGAVFRFIGVQHVSNQRTSLTKLGPLVLKRWNAVSEKAFHADKEMANYSSALAPLIGTDPGANKRKQVIYTKLVLRQKFPMTFNEALNPAPLNPLPSYVKYLNNLGVTASSATTASFESAACLLMALQQQDGAGGFNPEDLGTSSTADFDLGNGNKIKALVDAWGQPLAFYRWPTDSLDLNPNGPQPGVGNDPGDPEGYLTTPAYLTSGSPRTQLEALLGYTLPNRTASGGPQSYKLLPLIVSSGPDKVLDLSSPTALKTGPGVNDNLSTAAP